MKGEIGPSEKHEATDYHVNINTIVVSDAKVLRRKSTGCHRAKGMAERVKKRHSPEH